MLLGEVRWSTAQSMLRTEPKSWSTDEREWWEGALGLMLPSALRLWVGQQCLLLPLPSPAFPGPMVVGSPCGAAWPCSVPTGQTAGHTSEIAGSHGSFISLYVLDRFQVFTGNVVKQQYGSMRCALMHLEASIRRWCW